MEEQEEAEAPPGPDGRNERPSAADAGRSDEARQETSGTRIATSRGLAGWLSANNVSLAFTSYQTGYLYCVGVRSRSAISFQRSEFPRATGLAASGKRLLLATHHQVWRLENALKPGQIANEYHDRLYVARAAHVTGDIDIHELAVDRAGQVVFVNTKYSCLATLSATHSFKPVWKPKFISALVPEDRCHLNGLAMQDGAPRFVTAVSFSDSVSGWRDRRAESGIVIDVTNDRIVADGLSMPHSPRVHEGALWVLDSGRGHLVRIDLATKQRSDIAFCPGFLRGLAFHGRFAAVTTSLPRERAFSGLDLDANLKRRDAEARCAIYLIDIRSGGIVESIELSGRVTELFDVSLISGVCCPRALSPSSPQLASLITVEA